jgi:isoleucyl-tRNA synthetase
VRTVLDRCFDCLARWLAPVLCFTAEEAWTSRFGESQSVHLQQFPEVPPAWHDPALAERWQSLRAIRRLITTQIETARRDGMVASSLQAEVELAFSEHEAGLFAGYDWEELAIVSKVVLVIQPDAASIFANPEAGEGGAAHRPPMIRAATGQKCARCWRVLDEVGSVHAHPALCLRCADVVSALA